MSVTNVFGAQRGDEGKGRFVDMLAAEYDIVARYNGGPNAGHTVVTPDGEEYALHVVPSGIIHDHTMNVIGNGTFIDAVKLIDEIDTIRRKGTDVSPANLKISSAAHLILPHHVSADEIREAGSSRQGSTKSGIAPVAADRAMREGVRAEKLNNDLPGLAKAIGEGLRAQREHRRELGLPSLDEAYEIEKYVAASRELACFVTDTPLFLFHALRSGKRILAEGAQAFLLDIDHGMYPYVTSTSPGSGGVAPGLGVPPTAIDRIIAVAKATPSHVGEGPFVTEITDEDMLKQLHGDMTTVDAEKGTTTGRVRRLGYLDLPAIRRANMINGTTEMAITKLDWVPRYGKTILVCMEYQRKGKALPIATDAAYKLEQSAPVFIEIPSWKEDISDTRRFDDLPAKAKDYIHFIERETGVPVTMIGVGPGRDQVIDRRTER